MTNIQIDLATEMIEKSAKTIKRLYSMLCNHPYYDNLQINVKPRNVKGYIKNDQMQLEERFDGRQFAGAGYPSVWPPVAILSQY